MIVISQKNMDKIIWSLFLFVMIFNPPIIPRINLFLAFISTLIILLKYRNRIKRIMRQSKINSWGFWIGLLFLYAFTIPLVISLLMNDIVNIENYSALINRFVVLFITVVPCAIHLICTLEKKGYDYHFFIETVINAGLIESFLCILAFLNPTIKEAFVNIMAKNAPSSLYENSWYITVRSYGFAGTLLDVFGFGIAVIAGISFLYGIIYKQRYIIYSVVILTSALLNARTGIVIYLISVFFSIYYIFRQKLVKLMIRIIFAIIVILLLSVGVIYIVSQNSATMGWIRTLVNSIKGAINEKSVRSLGSLFSDNFWELPGGMRIIIGTAHSKFGATGYSHSDVGYINDIWFSGIIGCCISYGSLAKITLNVYKNCGNDILIKLCMTHILLCFFIFNIKAASYAYNPGMATILTIIFVFNYYVSINKEPYMLNSKNNREICIQNCLK